MSDNLVEDRNAIVDYLRRELIGPCGGDSEELAEDPSKRYSAGILYPCGSAIDDATGEEEQDVGGASSDNGWSEVNENQSDDPIVLANQFLPASMGISFYLIGNPSLLVQIRAARYLRISEKQVEHAPSIKRTRSRKWRRQQLSPPSKDGWLEVSPGRHKAMDQKVLDGSARLNVIWRAGREGWLVTVTLINDGETRNRTIPEAESCLYQVGFRCRPMVGGYIPAYPQSRILSPDEEERRYAMATPAWVLIVVALLIIIAGATSAPSALAGEPEIETALGGAVSNRRRNANRQSAWADFAMRRRGFQTPRTKYSIGK